MAEEKFIQSPENYADEKGMPVTIYSTSGNKRTLEEFRQVAESYVLDKKQTKGFTVVPKDSPHDVIRGFYESNINQPLQEGAQALGQKMAQAPEQGAGGLGQVARLLSGAPGYAASTVNTPEKLGAAIGGTAAAIGSAGMSLAPQALMSAAGTGAGYLLGQYAGGSNKGQGPGTVIGEPLMAAAAGAASQGFVGMIKAGLGRSVTQKANEGMALKLRELIETKYPHLAKLGPDGVNALASTKDGLADLMKIGVSGLRESADDTASNFVSLLNQNMPRTLKKATQEEVAGLIKEHTKLANKMLDNIGDEEAITTTSAEMTKVLGQVKNLVVGEFSKPGSTDLMAATAMRRILNAYTKNIEGFQDGATLLKLMKKSEAQLGFNSSRFQKVIYDELKNNPAYGGGSQFINEAERIAFRGGQPGLDRPVNFGVRLSDVLPGSLKATKLGRAVSGINLGKEIGTKYSGNFPKSLEGTAVSIPALKEYLDRK